MTRAYGATMPTWTKGVPAFIVEPSIWYFDPESRVFKMNFQSWMNAVPETLAAIAVTYVPPTQRSFTDFVVEDYECVGAIDRRFPGDTKEYRSRGPDSCWFSSFR